MCQLSPGGIGSCIDARSLLNQAVTFLDRSPLELTCPTRARSAVRESLDENAKKDETAHLRLPIYELAQDTHLCSHAIQYFHPVTPFLFSTEDSPNRVSHVDEYE